MFGDGQLLLNVFLGAIVATVVGLVLWSRHRSRQALIRRIEELTALGEASAKIVEAQLDLDALCALIYKQAREVVFARTYQIGLYDGDWYDIRFWMVRSDPRPPTRFNLNDGLGEGLVGWVRRTRRPLLVRDFQAENTGLPAQPRYLSDDPPRAALFVPLLAGGEAVGAIAVQSDEAGAFTEQHQHLLSIIASQSAAAIQNARLLNRERTRARQLELVGRVSRQVAAILELDDLFTRVAALTQETFGYYCVNLLTVDPRLVAPDGTPRGMLILEATTSPLIRERGLPISVGEGVIGWVAQHGQTALANDVTTEARFVYLPALSETRAELAVPLKIEDRVLGVLDVQSTRPSDFDADDQFVLETLADQVAVAIHEARLYRAARRRAQQLDAIAQVSRAAVSLLDLDELLSQVAELIAGRFRYPEVAIFLLDVATGDSVFRAGNGSLAPLWAEINLRYRGDAEGLIPWTARYGESALVPDVTREARYRPGPGESGHGSEMCVPLRVAGEVLGVLDVSSQEIAAFGDDDLYVVQTLADSVAIAVRNATLYAAERRRREAAEALRHVAEALTSTLDLQSLFDSILDGLAQVLHYDVASILLLDEGDMITVAAARGQAAWPDLVGQVLHLGDSAQLRELSRTRESQEFLYYDATGAYHRLLGVPHTHSCLGVPLLARDVLIGFIAIDALESGRYDAEDAEVVMIFAHQAAIAIDNARLFTTQREEAWVSNALVQVAEATGQATELEDVLATVTRITPLLVGIDRCGLLLWEPEFDLWRGTHAYEVETGWIDAFAEVRLHPSMWPALDVVQARGVPVIITPGEAKDVARAQLPDSIEAVFGGLALLLLPLMAKGNVMGVIVVAHNEPAFSQRRIELISGIANQAALAIEGAQLYAAQQEEVWVSTALLQVAEAVGSLTDLEEVLATVVRLAPLLMGVQCCAVLLWDEMHQIFAPGEVFGLDLAARPAFKALRIHPADVSLLAGVLRERRALIAGAERDYPLPEALATLLNVNGLLALPLISKGRFLGTMLVDWPESVERTGRRRMNILSGMAHQAALAIENARLYTDLAAQQRLERELEVAREIQMSFLPDRSPDETGWETSAFYQAAHSVGGDFYDFIRLPDNRWGLVIADVSDKGVGAALFMALSRTLLRAVALGGRSPGASLSRVNDLLLADSRTDLFVTCFYAAWSPQTARLVYASAGHNPPLLISHANGETKTMWLHCKGIALGVVPEITLDEEAVRMVPGDVLVLYTDGVTEALSAEHEEFGTERLCSVVTANATASADTISQMVRRAVDDFTANMPQFDDFTMVVIKRLEKA